MDNELLVFAEPGQMDIQTDLEKFYAKANITGSKNNDLYTEYKKGKSAIIGMFMGEVMKRSKGKADPKVTNELLINKLKEA